MQFRNREPENAPAKSQGSEEAEGFPRGRARSDGSASAEPPTESVIDAGVRFEGEYRARNDLRIQGSVSGEMICRGTLTIEEHAQSNARLDAQNCEIFGTVEGEITCAGRIRLGSTAVVNATMRAGSFMVDEGATITGSIETNYTGEVGQPRKDDSRQRKK